MKPLIQIGPATDTPHIFNRDEVRIGAQIIQIARPAADANADLERSRQINRIDALKVLIRSLLDHLDELTQPGPASEADLSLQAMVRRFEAELIRQALMRTGGKQRQAARLLGEKKTTLNAKILRYGIRVEEPGSQPADERYAADLSKRP
jgi:transcriptional regulator with GAF, ATPase, and Fis domain